MSQGSRQNRQFALTYDQRLLLDMYINFYNHTTRQMDALYDLQSEIRGHINQIVGLNPIHNHSNNSNRNFTESFSNNRQQNSSSRRNNNNNNNNNRTQYGRDYPDIGERSSNSRVVYIEGVPYLLDLTNFMRVRNTNNTNNTNNTDAANLWRSFYDNITVAPTRTQIENATRIVQFSEITTPLNSSCPITLERFEETTSVTQILHCGHIFTPSGIESWFESNVRCPVCRYDIRDYRAQPLPTTTREERHSWTDPGNDEESKEEQTLEETKEDVNSNTSSTINERRSNLNRQNTHQRSRRITSENVTNVLSNITEEIINNLFHPNGTGNAARSLFDQPQNSLFYDSSNNQFIFEGFIRR
jgi:Ring finger domain